MRFEFPWPPKEVTPNFKRSHHWTKYHKHIKAYREQCGWIAKRIKPDRYEFTVIFYPPDKRKRDHDGMIGSFKAGLDGIADAWGVDDNLFRVVYEFSDPVKNGKIVLTTGL